jgi:hypothetical protein
MVGLTAITLPTTFQTLLWLSFLMFGLSSFDSMHTGALEQPAEKSGEEHESNAAGGSRAGIVEPMSAVNRANHIARCWTLSVDSRTQQKRHIMRWTPKIGQLAKVHPAP